MSAMHPDARLLALCATVHAVQDKIAAHGPFVGPKGEAQLARLSHRSMTAVERAGAIPAKTLEGHKAKAAAVARRLSVYADADHDSLTLAALQTLRGIAGMAA